MPDTKVWMDTRRPNAFEMPSLVECHANVNIEGEDVRLEVMSFVGTNHAFDKMEKVLKGMGFFGEKVRVH